MPNVLTVKCVFSLKHASKIDSLSRLHRGVQRADRGLVNLLQRSNGACACHEGLWRSEGTTPLILDLGTRRKCVVNFTSQSFYPWEICCIRLIFNCKKMHFPTRHSTKTTVYLISCYGTLNSPLITGVLNCQL
jgi:hypothetical protein